MKGAPTDLRSRASRARRRKTGKEREGERERGEGRRAPGGGEGLDRLIYLLSDQPTYLPTNLPTRDDDSWYRVAKPRARENESCLPNGDEERERKRPSPSKTHLVLAQGGLLI